MSKNFEQEYKALAENDLPDLWDRIEAGLSSKTITSKSSEAKESIGETGAEEIQEVITGKKSQADHNRAIFYFSKYKTVVAAAICVIVILPAFLVLGKINTSKSYSTAEAADEASDAAAPMMEAADTAAIAETAEEAAYAEEAPEEGMTAEGGMEAEERMVAEESMAADEAYDDSMSDMLASEDNGTAGSAAGGITEDLKEEAQKQQADASSAKKSSEIIYQNVTVKVLEATGDEVVTQKDWFCGMKVEVVSDPAGELEQGTELTLWVSLTSSVAYVNGKEYELDISYDPDRECDYQIEAAHF
ncbi:MAG: hypothetical protein Q4D94_05065 [Bacillota bacterium]|nr:hypothetical protein [Bacillota bacterium]